MKKLFALIVGSAVLFSACDKTIIGPNPKPIVSAPAVHVRMDNTNAFTAKLPYLLGGNSTGVLAAITIQADSLTQIDSAIVYVETPQPAMTAASVTVCDSDKMTVIAQNANIQGATVVKNLGQFSGAGKTIYLKTSFNLIGKDQVGVLNAPLSFRIGCLSARIVGGNRVTVIYENDSTLDRTNSSVVTQVVAARISSVAMVNSAQGYAVSSAISGTGWNNAAIIRVTTDASGNTIANGDLARMILDKIRLNIQKNSAMTVSEVQIGRIRPSDMIFLSAPYSATTEIDMTNPVIGGDEEINPASDAYYLVRANIASLDNSGQNWIEVNLDHLDGDNASANFVWRDGSDAAQKSPLKLAYSMLTGTKITD